MNNLTVPHDILNSDPSFDDWSILTGYRGSIAHGTHIQPDDPTSIDDVDLMMLYVPPPPYVLGLKEHGSRGTVEFRHDAWDIVAYDLRKMCQMLERANPNVLSFLWLAPAYYLKTTAASAYLIAHRDLFLTRQVYKTFSGYAWDQLRKMQSSTNAYQGYMGMRRKQLVDRFGFDVKQASHLIRLLRMGIEALETRQIQVARPDADELRAIKHGRWTFEQVIAEAERLFEQIRVSFNQSSLPERTDADAVSDLCQTVMLEAWRERGYLPLI